MPKANRCLVSVWIKNHPELTLEKEEVFCKACGKVVTCKKKSQIDQHVATWKHKSACERIKKTKILQTSLQQCISSASSRTADQKDFNLRLCEALLSANIPLNKVQNHKFKQFLETFCKKNIPHESTLRQNYVSKMLHCKTLVNIITYHHVV
jgi:hypothetical protein